MQDIVVIREIRFSPHHVQPLWKEQRGGLGARGGVLA
jgi:hypothetical protein